MKRRRLLLTLAGARRRIRPAGGPVFHKPFLDAAFSKNIFLWDTCFIACYAKYHQGELPIANALDNFYVLRDADGWICREYDQHGRPVWPKAHPVSVSPPLLAFAELELFDQSGDLARLRRVYPAPRRNFDYLAGYLRRDDGLCFNDAPGSGMDNIPRHPVDCQDDGKGIALGHEAKLPFDYHGMVPPERTAPLLRHLLDPASFWRGGVWAPTNYMVIRGLAREFIAPDRKAIFDAIH